MREFHAKRLRAVNIARAIVRIAVKSARAAAEMCSNTADLQRKFQLAHTFQTDMWRIERVNESPHNKLFFSSMHPWSAHLNVQLMQIFAQKKLPRNNYGN